MDKQFAENAQRLGVELLELGGVGRAMDIIDELASA